MKKRKRRLLKAMLVVAFVFVAGMITINQTVMKEHREIMNLPLESVDLNMINNGVFVGEFDGGMYGWRKNKVQVTIENKKIVDIKLLEPSLGDEENELLDLYNRVIDNQSLDVDAISGATVSSKGYLKAVEDALIHASQ